MTKILVNNDSDNGLVPASTKPLPEPMLTLDSSWCNLTENVQNLSSEINFHVSYRGQWVKSYSVIGCQELKSTGTPS